METDTGGLPRKRQNESSEREEVTNEESDPFVSVENRRKNKKIAKVTKSSVQEAPAAQAVAQEGIRLVNQTAQEV
ncbi:hypothetical protein JTB14_018650 [Gonioctena quinquepunctata]|nr:hypothetical protein JTB14_018650 [Gonioctena quinquepunctata]